LLERWIQNLALAMMPGMGLEMVPCDRPTPAFVEQATRRCTPHSPIRATCHATCLHQKQGHTETALLRASFAKAGETAASWLSDLRDERSLERTQMLLPASPCIVASGCLDAIPPAAEYFLAFGDSYVAAFLVEASATAAETESL
jgi:hypothetical protein